MDTDCMLQLTCFVIMPFGEKTDADGRVIDFNDIYKGLIKPAVEGVTEFKINCVRCDEIHEPGIIQEKMIRSIQEAEVVVADLSTLNPNVFWELGVRHALARGVTVLIRSGDVKIPFDVRDIDVILYNPARLSELQRTQETIREYITQGLRLFKTDSPVYKHLPNLSVSGDARELTEVQKCRFELQRLKERLKKENRPGKFLGIVTGNLDRVKGIDVWVNSENTHMQMARFFERSISSLIRYRGARRDATGNVVEDVIADALAAEMKKRNLTAPVAPGLVIPTTSGNLDSRGVKRIYHAAAVIGQYGMGYTPIPNLSTCISAALDLASSAEESPYDLKSIVFPLMGTGTAQEAAERVTRDLMGAALRFLEGNPDSPIREVFFLAFSDRDLRICQYAIQSFGNRLKFQPEDIVSQV